LLIISVAIFGVYNLRELENETSENQYNLLINDLSKVTTNFSTWISIKKEMLETTKDFVNNFSYDEITEDQINNRFLDINNDDEDVSQVYMGLADGRFVTGGQWIPPEDYDPRTRVWYKDAVKNDDTIISSIYTDRETGSQLVTISSPLFINEAFVGVISADVFLNNINKFLSNQIHGENIYAYLLDHEGDIIVHTNKSHLIGSNLYEDIQNEAIIKYYEEVKKTDEIVDMKYIYNNKNIKGITQKVKNVDWYLVVAVEEIGVSGLLKNIKKNNIFFNIFVTLVIVLLLFLLTKIKQELDAKNEMLAMDNEKDFLTEIYNRRYFDQWMDQLWEESKNIREISLLMMDLDYFKEYNDLYGHVKGDKVLKDVTGIISELTRKEDVFARYGGEEFTLVLKNVTSKAAEQIAIKIRDAIDHANIPHEGSLFNHITLSIGVANIIPKDRSQIRSFIHSADQALYQAKDQGRNKVVVDHKGESN